MKTVVIITIVIISTMVMVFYFLDTIFNINMASIFAEVAAQVFYCRIPVNVHFHIK